jgi:hypothetical protein
MPFSTPEAKAALAAAIEEATSGLKSKNTELLAELKKARKDSAITPEQLSEVEAERDKLQAELATAQKSAKDAAKAVETATKQLQAEAGFTQKLLIDNGLVSELTSNGVSDAINLKAAQAMLRSGIKVVIDGESRVAKVGDKALSEFVKEWAASDEGKRFVTAPANSGGGAHGGGGGKQTVDVSKLSATQKMEAGRKAA